MPFASLVDTKTLAKHLGFDPKTIRAMVRRGAIPAIVVRSGARSYPRFRIAEVENALRCRQ